MLQPRIKKIRDFLKEKNLDAILVSNPSNIIYLSEVKFLEPTQHEGFLVITKNKTYLITSSLYSEAVRKNSKEVELLEIKQDKNLGENLNELVTKSKIKNIGFEENDLKVSEYKFFSKFFKLKPTNQIIQNLRQIKDDEEIEKVENACEATDKCFDYILKEIKVGVSELEIANKIRRYFEDKGLCESFPAVVAFGPHSSMPHHVPTQTKLKKDQIVLIDFGASFENYASDMTRTVFFGKAPEKFKQVYNTVLESQTKAFEYLNQTKNPSFKNADNEARKYIISENYPSIPHSLGHGVGLEVHDGLRLSPTSKENAKNNMAFTLEPGIYIEDYGGVRIEDVVLYKNGLKFLTHSKRDLIEI